MSDIQAPQAPMNVREAGLLEEVGMSVAGYMLSDRLNEIMRNIHKKEARRRVFRASRAYDIREGSTDDVDINLFGEVGFTPTLLTLSDE